MLRKRLCIGHEKYYSAMKKIYESLKLVKSELVKILQLVMLCCTGPDYDRIQSTTSRHEFLSAFERWDTLLQNVHMYLEKPEKKHGFPTTQHFINSFQSKTFIPTLSMQIKLLICNSITLNISQKPWTGGTRTRTFSSSGRRFSS
jgi:hypothetical protein